MDKKPVRVCPYCGKSYRGAPAQSRRDKKTRICPDCGLMEAMEDSGINDIQKKEIMEKLHSHMDAGKGTENDG